MNELTESISSVMSPQMAVIVYSEARTNGVYLERRDINNGKMGPGHPLTKDCISKIIQTLAEDSDDIELGFSGIVPPTLLYADTNTGRTKLVWYNPPRKRMMYFVQSLGIPDGEITVPGMLYCVENGNLKVWTFKGRKPKNELFMAPYFNTNDSSVCLGTANAKKPIHQRFEDEIKYWEEMFWKSEFSHIYGPNPINGNLAVITKECIEKKIPFPTDLLIPSKRKLKDILK